MAETMDTLNYVKNRLAKMKSARSEFEWEWDLCDLQFAAESYEDPTTWRFIYNDDMEQALIEQEVWRTAWEIIFDVKPSTYDTDIEKLESSKYVLRSFLDKENAYREFRTFKQDKARYWTGIFFTGLRYEAYNISKVDDQEVDSMVNWFFSKKFKKKVRVDSWFFTPQNLSIRSVYIDDKFIRQNNPDKLEDCIIKESVSYDTLELKYKWNNSFNQDWIGIPWVSDVSPDYWVNPVDQSKMHVLHHYYNKTSRKYIIMLNEKFVLYEWEMLYIRNSLPIRIAQHYPDSWCIYWISIPRKVRSNKAVKINMMQAIIDWARIWSGKLIATGNWSEFLDQIYVPSGGIGMAQLSSSVDQIKEIDTRVDINWPINALDIINRNIRESTGIDIWAPFETKDETLWQTEIREQNKATRHRAMDEIYNQCVDQVLTDTLSNIAQFAPVLLRSQKSIIVNGKKTTEAIERPKIKIENVRVSKKGWRTIIDEDMWSFWFLELAPETLPWDCMVNIVTPYTNSTISKQIEKESFTSLVTTLTELSNIYWPTVIEEIPFDEVWNKAKQAYQFDWKQFTAVSKKEKLRRQANDKIKKLNDAAQQWIQLLNQQQNATQDQATNWQPQAPQVSGTQPPIPWQVWANWGTWVNPFVG